MSIKKYNGIVVPAVTPLTADFQLDADGVKRLFGFFYEHGVHPFILGTTGEAASLPFSLKRSYIEQAGRLKNAGSVLYVGISSNVFVESVGLAKHAFDAGADVVVATLPSYYQLDPSAMERYFGQLAEAVKGPMMIYNIPATTHMSIPLEVIENLSHHPFIVGVKDSERSDERLDGSLQRWRQRQDFSYFLGWAARSAAAMTNGSDGLVPSTGNFAPAVYTGIWQSVKNGEQQRAQNLQQASDGLGDVYQKGRNLGTSLWALKTIMKELGLCDNHVMPPIYPQSSKDEQQLVEEFHRVNKLSLSL